MIASRAKQANTILFYILCAFPLFLPHWISMVAALTLLSGLVYVFAGKQFSFSFAFLIPLAGILVPFILRLPGTDNLQLGLQTIQVRLILLVLPLTFSFKSLWLTETQQRTAYSILCAASVLTVLRANLLMAVKGFTHPVGFENADLTFSYRVSLEYYSGLHPTYYCAIVYMAAFIQLYRLLKHTIVSPFEKYLAYATIVICTLGGIAAASRATFIAYLLLSLILVVWHFRKHPLRWYVIGALVVGCALLWQTPMIQNRLQEMNVQNMEAPKDNNDNGTNVRSGIFACDASLLKEHWLWGVGTGNIQSALNNCLSRYNTDVYKSFNYNTHNEYLNMWLTTGLLGFLVFVTCLVYPFWRALRSGYTLPAYFLLFMAICFVTENYLDRQMGVTFFALMQTLFFFKTLSPTQPR